MRINFIANLISNADVVCDIGSDHAMLSKILIDENRAKIVYNIEKNKLPLQNTIKNTSSSKYIGKVFNYQSDGLTNFKYEGQIDYIVISGMGGKLICDIINTCVNHKFIYIITCPNNNEFLIREFVRNNNLRINNEFILFDNNYYYEIIVITQNDGYLPKTKIDFLFGKINLEKNIELLKKKYQSFINFYSNSDALKYNKKIQDDYNLILQTLNLNK